MDKLVTINTTIVERTRVDLTDQQIATILLERFGMAGGTVDFDISSGVFLRGAQLEVVRTTESFD